MAVSSTQARMVKVVCGPLLESKFTASATTLATTATTATQKATVTAPGRSPGASGFSAARASSSRARPRA